MLKRYIGNKTNLLYNIYASINDKVKNLNSLVFCDLFAGTGSVSYLFADKVKYLLINDLEYYSFIINNALFSPSDIKTANFIIDYLNEKIKQDIITNNNHIFDHFSENGKHNRLYFSEKHGKIIDYLRNYIFSLKEENFYYYLLASLLIEVNNVANTTGMYDSFLKKLQPNTQKQFVLKKIDTKFKSENKIYNEDANNLILKIEGDVLYLDPPYNQRQYSDCYHLLNTIAIDKKIESYGTCGYPLLENRNRSNFSLQNKTESSFEDIIKNAKFKVIIISYNNCGTISIDSMINLLKKYGDLVYDVYEYKAYKSSKNNKLKTTKEYLFFCFK